MLSSLKPPKIMRILTNTPYLRKQPQPNGVVTAHFSPGVLPLPIREGTAPPWRKNFLMLFCQNDAIWCMFLCKQKIFAHRTEGGFTPVMFIATPLIDWLIDWLIEHGLTSPPTQYRLYGRRFYRSKDPTNSTKVLKEHKEYTNNTKIQKHTCKHKTQQIP